jgi:hypothetical protein
MAILTARPGIANNKIKLPKLIIFNRTCSKLKIFLINIEIHIKTN